MTRRRAVSPLATLAAALLFALPTASLLTACATTPAPARVQLEAEVAATERAFAKTMADRDLNAFASFISRDAVFFSGTRVLRGKAAVVESWRRLYAGPDAPFSWAPEQVEALDSGELALSTGPVYDQGGKLVAHFTTIWRREGPHEWRVVYDKGDDVCDCAAAGK